MTGPAEATYKQGDVIGGKYEVHALLGQGGFGEVYSVYSRDLQAVYALKTFRQEFLADAGARDTFKREALLWVDLEEHPCILCARFVEEFSRRLFVAMDYIAPDERGRVTLADHLRQASGPIDTDQSLVWAIQFCHGMEHANGHGIKCHRDIKPANTLIRQDGTLLISDFGLAAAVEAGWKQQAALLPSENASMAMGAWASSATLQPASLGLLPSAGSEICGTPGYIPPELLDGAGADARSDIYSFGLVLWQMAAGSQLPPFAVGLSLPENPRDMYLYAFAINSKQKRERAPGVSGPLQKVIEGCLAPDLASRFASFAALRSELEPILKNRSGRTVQLPPRGELSVAYWNNRGVSLERLGRVDEAIAGFRKALSVDPKHKQLKFNLARALQTKGDFDAAADVYRALIREQPDYAEPHIGLGVLLDQRGDLDGADRELREAVRIRPDSPEGHYNLGLALHAQGDREEAVAAFRATIRYQPDNADAHHNLGVILGEMGDRDGAISAYREAIRFQPGDAVAHNNLGAALNAKGDKQGAIAAYRAAIRHQPNFAQAHLNLGLALLDQSDYDGAIPAFRAAIQLQPDLADAHVGLGVGLRTKGDLDGAIAAFHTAIRLNPRLAIAHCHLATALTGKNDLDGGIAAYRTAIGLEPELVKAHIGLGLNLKSKGDLDGAIAAWRTVIRLQPDLDFAYINLSAPLMQKGDFDGAIASCRTALALKPDNGRWHYQLGLALAQRQDVSAAWEEFKLAQKLDPNDPDIRNMYERIFEVLKGVIPGFQG